MSSKHDDNLIEKLQRTIDGWSSEVTDAHQKLTHQIGDAKAHLDTLIGVLGADKAEGAGSSPQTQGAARATAPPDSKAKSDSLEPPSATGNSDDRIQALERELSNLRSANEELTHEIAEKVYENRAAASELEVARSQLGEFNQSAGISPEEVEALREEIEHKASQLATVELEVKSLTTATETFKKEFGMQQEVYEQCEREATANLKTAEAFMDGQIAELQELKGKLTTLSLRNEQFAETEEAIKAELENARDDTQSLRQDLEESRQGKNEVKEELASIKLEYERQAEALNESVRELEAHWGLAKEAEEYEKSLKEQILELETNLSEEASAVVRAREDLQSSQHQLIQERQKHAEELEKVRAQNQEGIYSMLKTLGEHGLSQGETDAALELTRKQATIEELGHLNAALSEGMQKLEARLKELEVSGGLSPSDGASEQQPGQAELEGLRAELAAFEEQLVVRERAIEAAANRMRSLEETAIAVQAQVTALHAEHMTAGGSGADQQELAEAHREIDNLKYNLTETTDLKDGQAIRIRELENGLAEREERAERSAPKDEEALAVSKDMPHILNQALAEIDTLRKGLAERDAQVDELKQELTELAESEEITQMTFAARDANGQPRTMGEILIDAGIITSKQLESALEEQRTAKKRRLGSILVEKGLIREEIVAQVVGSQLNLPFVRLEKRKIEQGALAFMDGRLATHHMCFPISATTEKITVAMANPLDLIAIEDLEFATSLKVQPVVATLSDITSAIVKHYGVTIANTIAEDAFEPQISPKLPTQNTAPPVRKDR